MSVGSPASTTLGPAGRRPGSARKRSRRPLRAASARWPGSHWFAAAEAFHRDFAAVALERGWLRLWVIELDGRPAAAWYGFRFEGIDSYYQGGRDPALTRERLGLVLTIHTVREAIADGIEEYRSRAATSPSSTGSPPRSRRGDDRGPAASWAGPRWPRGPPGGAYRARRRTRRPTCSSAGRGSVGSQSPCAAPTA